MLSNMEEKAMEESMLCDCISKTTSQVNFQVHDRRWLGPFQSLSTSSEPDYLYID